MAQPDKQSGWQSVLAHYGVARTAELSIESAGELEQKLYGKLKATYESRGMSRAIPF
jgi:hypothetical protein